MLQYILKFESYKKIAKILKYNTFCIFPKCILTIKIFSLKYIYCLV